MLCCVLVESYLHPLDFIQCDKTVLSNIRCHYGSYLRHHGNNLPSYFHYLCVITSSTAANKAQVVESGHLVLDGGRSVAKLS